MLKRLLLFAALTFSFAGLTCKDTPPGPPPPGRDTTSQNFTITTWEYGDGYSSAYANDAWIFDQNNIWVVGEFPDTGSAPSYNIMRWNGTAWKGYARYFNSSGMNEIWALDSSRLYLADGLLIIYKNGVFTRPDFTIFPWTVGQSIDHVWASSESNVWGVGANGCIVHFDGTKWSKIDFDAQFRFMAITGSATSGVAYATARNMSFNTLLVRLTGTTPEIIFQGGDQLHPQSIEFMAMQQDSELLLSGEPVRSFNVQTGEMDTLYHPSMYMGPIGYAAWNDIFFFASYQGTTRLLHYNGQRFAESALPTLPDVYITYGASARAGMAICAGMTGNKAHLTIIKRSGE